MGDYTNLSVNLDLSLDVLGDLIGPVCDELGAILEQARANADTAAQNVVDGLPENPLITDDEQQALKDALFQKLLKNALKQAREACEAPGVPALENLGNTLVPGLMNVLDILTARQIRQLLNGDLGKLGGTLGGAVGGVTGGGGGGGGGGIKLPSLPRADLNSTYQEPQPIDPFGLAAYGLDAGLGTMLLQGVAEVR
jgi:hypothetical protein